MPIAQFILLYLYLQIQSYSISFSTILLLVKETSCSLNLTVIKQIMVSAKLIEFIGASKLLSSNGSFDLRFLNHELSELNMDDFGNNQIIDLLKSSREHFPSEPANLDYYVDKFNINLEDIDAKGAILDATITALVFQRCFYEIYNAGK